MHLQTLVYLILGVHFAVGKKLNIFSLKGSVDDMIKKFCLSAGHMEIRLNEVRYDTHTVAHQISDGTD